ncbi:hypothetical protein GCM10025786_21660 [Nocardioides caeni]|uniref:Putative Flp pilus-assembly TadG-like N-terminal domain-containing protein n=2 Tax=Nocardioides caeni TaxID=574700 RepID=A0A4S8N2A8_9ACTN|nr:hypothetical protein E9934_17545 [Nocardioides caeni]
MAGVLLLIGCAAGVVGALVVDHRRAQAAADLAALAGAAAVSDPTGLDPCAEAAAIVRANGAGLVSCVASGAVVTVEVSVTGPRWLGQRADLSARARAGPVA